MHRLPEKCKNLSVKWIMSNTSGYSYCFSMWSACVVVVTLWPVWFEQVAILWCDLQGTDRTGENCESVTFTFMFRCQLTSLSLSASGLVPLICTLTSALRYAVSEAMSYFYAIMDNWTAVNTKRSAAYLGGPLRLGPFGVRNFFSPFYY